MIEIRMVFPGYEYNRWREAKAAGDLAAMRHHADRLFEHVRYREGRVPAWTDADRREIMDGWTSENEG